MNRILVIGVGGSGRRVVGALNALQNESPQPNMLIRVIDPDQTGDERILVAGKLWGESDDQWIELAMTPAREIIREAICPALDLNPELLNTGSLFSGQQLPPLGKLTLWDNAELIIAGIRDALDRLYQRRVPFGDEETVTRLFVVIVGSIVGGTGAGMAVALPYLVRRVLAERGLEGIATLIGIFNGPDSIPVGGRQRRQLEANYIATLKELMYAQRGKVGRLELRGVTVRAEGRAYDHVFLTDVVGHYDRDTLAFNTANFVMALAGKSGRVMASRLDNIHRTLDPRIGTFGCAAVTLRKAPVARWCSVSAVLTAATSIFNSPFDTHLLPHEVVASELSSQIGTLLVPKRRVGKVPLARTQLDLDRVQREIHSRIDEIVAEVQGRLDERGEEVVRSWDPATPYETEFQSSPMGSEAYLKELMAIIDSHVERLNGDLVDCRRRLATAEIRVRSAFEEYREALKTDHAAKSILPIFALGRHRWRWLRALQRLLDARIRLTLITARKATWQRGKAVVLGLVSDHQGRVADFRAQLDGLRGWSAQLEASLNREGCVLELDEIREIGQEIYSTHEERIEDVVRSHLANLREAVTEIEPLFRANIHVTVQILQQRFGLPAVVQSLRDRARLVLSVNRGRVKPTELQAVTVVAGAGIHGGILKRGEELAESDLPGLWLIRIVTGIPPHALAAWRYEETMKRLIREGTPLFTLPEFVEAARRLREDESSGLMEFEEDMACF